nr:tRNA adenosine(34) deaminase TadA [Desulfogranum japonicum]
MIPADTHYMNLAYMYAENAAQMDEVPVGAVLVSHSGLILAGAGNNCIRSCDPTGHAEIHVLRQAGLRLCNYRFPGTTMYITLEPCAMCAAAMVHARVSRLVIGADDPKTGAVYSRYEIGSDGRLNHSFKVESGVLKEQCSQILKDFFKKKR